MRRLNAGLWFFSILCLGISFTFAEENKNLKRFGIFVGANKGGAGREILQYASNDAESIRRVFVEMGGLGEGDGRLLIQPTGKELLAELAKMRERFSEARGVSKRTEFVFYYSGHSDEDGLLLDGDKVSYSEIRAGVGKVESDLRIVILDSCSSGAFTRLKGGVKHKAFLSDEAVTAKGYAFLTSSSSGEASQESDRIGGSYFTHSLVSGLRGAADLRGDGRVTLSEAYQYAYQDTLEKTAAAGRGVQHPNFDIQISGAGEVVLTDLKDISSSLEVEAAVEGRCLIRGASGNFLAEVQKIKGHALGLGLPAGKYKILLENENHFSEAATELVSGKRTLISEKNFSFVKPDFRDNPIFSKTRPAVWPAQLLLGSFGGAFGGMGSAFIFALIGHVADPSVPIGVYGSFNAPTVLGLTGFAAGNLVLSALIVHGLAQSGSREPIFAASLLGSALGTAVCVPLAVAIAYGKSGSALLPALIPIFIPGISATLFSNLLQKRKTGLSFYVLPTAEGGMAGFVVEI